MPKTKAPHREAGLRLRKELVKRFGSVYAAAKHLVDDKGKPMNPDTLYQFTQGYRLPSNKTQARLRRVGIDYEYVVTGSSEHRKKLKEQDDEQTFYIGNPVSPERYKLLQKVLHELAELPENEIQRLLAIWKATQQK